MANLSSGDSDLKTADVHGGPSLLQRAASVISSEWLQPFWETVEKVSSRGRGYSNIHPELNGEAYFLDTWVKMTKNHVGPLIVFDVGANEGDFTQMLLKRCAAQVYCFEPNPETASRLRTRFQSRDGVVVNNIALGKESGSMCLYDQSGKAGTGLATAFGEVLSDLYQEETRSVQVNVQSMDEFVFEHSIKKIHLLKIDTEGYEYPILSGAKRTLESGIVDWIQFEFNVHNATQGFTFYKFFKLLHGFDLFRMLPHALYPVTQDGATSKSVYGNEVYKYANFVARRRGQ